MVIESLLWTFFKSIINHIEIHFLGFLFESTVTHASKQIFIFWIHIFKRNPFHNSSLYKSKLTRTVSPHPIAVFIKPRYNKYETKYVKITISKIATPDF